MAHNKGSLDYKVINEKITKVLDNRSRLNNTVQVAMPFVKATTTIQHEILGEGCIGFTLGLHAINEDVKYEDMYSNQSGDMPLIGYTYQENGNNKRVYAVNQNDQIISRIFDSRAYLASNTNFVRVPPPGITQATVSRYKNGVLASAQLNISVASLVQLESLQKVFLVPGLGMVLEWGQQFATPDNFTATNISDYMFPWHDRAKVMPKLTQLARNKIGLVDILEESVYTSNGQYMWMFGRVANFSIKSNSDGSFECVVKIIGPSEDSWAYSTTNTVVPAKDESVKIQCGDSSNSVYGYFTDTAAGAFNFKSLLDKVLSTPTHPWRKHVIKFTQGNQKSGEPQPNGTAPIISNIPFADSEDAYFITWRFFVNVVLNDETDGLKGIFKKASLTENEREKIGMLLPYLTANTEKASTTTPGPLYLDDENESFVGMNKYLRSVDLSTMILVNEKAVQLAKQNEQYNIPGATDNLLNREKIVEDFIACGLFDKSAPDKYQTTANDPDRGFLSTGVWLNHKAIVESMAGADTIVRGITNLLERMNQATLNYWQLALDRYEPSGNNPNKPSFNYMVVDANWKDSSESAVNKFMDKVHIFNKYIRVNTIDGTSELVGSELIDCSVNLDLPKRLFTQIATLGLVQPEDIQKVSDMGKTKDELDAEVAAEQAAGRDYTNIRSPIISDPNNTLREMFAITVLNPTSKQSPDLTILPKTEREQLVALNGLCGKGNVQLTAQTAGVGNKPANIIASEAIQDKNNTELDALRRAAQTTLNSEQCQTCQQCQPPLPPGSSVGALSPNTLKYITDTPWSAGFISYVMQNAQVPFVAAAAHTTYAEKIRNGEINGWTALNPVNNKVEVGDIIVENRGGTLTFNNPPWSGPSHGDVVTSISGNKVTTVGGNFSEAVTTRTRIIKENGFIESNSVFVILRPPSNSVGAIVQVANREMLKWSRNSWKETTPAAYDSLRSYYNAGNIGGREILKPAITLQQVNPEEAKKICTDVYTRVGKGNFEDGKKLCDECEKQREILRQSNVKIEESVEKIQSAKEKVIREFPNLQNIFIYLEVFPEYMVSQIAGTSNGNFANAFGSAPGTLSIQADLTMPGINGLRVGELFWIDRIPTFYKVFGAFQIMNIEDTIGLDGWKTKINARFNFLGKKWKEAMVKKLETR